MGRKVIVIFFIFSLFLFTSFCLGEESKVDSSTKKLKIYYFYSPRCGACKKVKEKVLLRIKKKFKHGIKIKYYNTTNENDYKIMLAVSEELGLSEKERNLIPKIIINHKVLIGYDEINEKIDKIIKKALLQNKDFLEMESKIVPKNNLLIEKFKKFNIWGVLGAGLIDGVNPCAFATIIFFISFLGVAGYRKKELINIGICFILAVFLTYFLLGFGLFNFFFHLEIYNLLSKILYILIIIFTLGVSLLNFMDYYNLKKKKVLPKDMKLQLPSKIKKLIHKVIGVGYKRGGYKNREEVNYLKLIGVTFVIGVIIALLESVCTGQVYLPTISFIASGTKFKFEAIFFLILYNVMFIIPLIAVFVLALTGVTSQELAQFSRKNLGIIKLLTGILLFALAIGLFYYIFF